MQKAQKAQVGQVGQWAPRMRDGRRLLLEGSVVVLPFLAALAALAPVGLPFLAALVLYRRAGLMSCKTLDNAQAVVDKGGSCVMDNVRRLSSRIGNGLPNEKARELFSMFILFHSSLGIATTPSGSGYYAGYVPGISDQDAHVDFPYRREDWYWDEREGRMVERLRYRLVNERLRKMGWAQTGDDVVKVLDKEKLPLTLMKHLYWTIMKHFGKGDNTTVKYVARKPKPGKPLDEIITIYMPGIVLEVTQKRPSSLNYDDPVTSMVQQLKSINPEAYAYCLTLKAFLHKTATNDWDQRARGIRGTSKIGLFALIVVLGLMFLEENKDREHGKSSKGSGFTQEMHLYIVKFFLKWVDGTSAITISRRRDGKWHLTWNEEKTRTGGPWYRQKAPPLYILHPDSYWAESSKSWDLARNLHRDILWEMIVIMGYLTTPDPDRMWAAFRSCLP